VEKVAASIPVKQRLVRVFDLPAMQLIQLLRCNLISSDRILVARPVEVDDIPGARAFGDWLLGT